MYIPTRDEVLGRRKLPEGYDPKHLKVEGPWESNHFTDEDGSTWYPVTYKAQPYRKKAWSGNKIPPKIVQ